MSTVLVASCVLSACSTDGGQDTVTMDDSPLAPYSAALWGDGDQSRLDEQAAQVETLVAECMKDEGFEYLPEEGNGVRHNTYNAEDQTDEGWVSLNGYGIVSAVTIADPAEQNALTANEEYLGGLSDSEEGAYYATLYGSDPVDATGEEYEYDWQKAGCRGAAAHDVAGSSELAADLPQFGGIIAKLNTLYTELANEPVMQALNADWADCMAEAGHPNLAGKFDAIQSITDELHALELNGAVAPDSTALGALHDREVEIALADLRCADELNYMKRSSAVQFTLEEQFVSGNKRELDEMLAVNAIRP